MEVNQDLQKDILSLISMLDEPDINLYGKISQSIINIGDPAMEMLEEAKENTFDPDMSERLEEVILAIHTNNIKEDLKAWKHSYNKDILQLLQILNKFHNRRLDTLELNNRVNSMHKVIWLEMNEDLTSLECIRLVNHFVFRTWQYKPDTSGKPETDLFFLNNAINNKTAHPSILGALYLGLCQRLNLPVYYVALPENFILAYTSQTSFKPAIETTIVLFYTNPLLEGIIFNMSEIEKFLKNHDVISKPEFFEPADNLLVASLLLREMKELYQASGNQMKINGVNQLINSLV